MDSVISMVRLVGVLAFAVTCSWGAPPAHLQDTVIQLWASDPLYRGPSVHRWLRSDGTFLDVYAIVSASRTFSSGLPLSSGTYIYEPGAVTARLRFAGDEYDAVPPELTLHFNADHGGTVSGFDPRYHRTGFSVRSAGPMQGAANVSCRSYVAAGRPAIAGFVLHGTVRRFVLLRAVGPTLSGFGVNDGLLDPALSVNGEEPPFVGSDRRGFHGNAPALATLAKQVGAFPLREGAADSLCIVELAPGPHTVVVTSASGQEEGTVLVEAYFLP